MKAATISLLMMFATLGSAQVSTPQSLTDAQTSELIEQVKQMPASRLDSGLPRERFAQWLQTEAGPGARIGWAMRYSPAAATDGGRDFPTCVEADAMMENGRSIIVLIGVGTPGKVGNRKAFVFKTQLMEPHDLIDLDHLRDLPAALSKMQQAASHTEVVK